MWCSLHLELYRLRAANAAEGMLNFGFQGLKWPLTADLETQVGADCPMWALYTLLGSTGIQASSSLAQPSSPPCPLHPTSNQPHPNHTHSPPPS